MPPILKNKRNTESCHNFRCTMVETRDALLEPKLFAADFTGLCSNIKACKQM